MMQEAIIESAEDFRLAIDTIASLMESAADLKARTKRLLDLAEDFAKANAGIVFPEDRAEGETELARYRLELEAPALKRLPGVSEEEVVRRLGEDKETVEFVKHTFDAPKLKAAFGTSKPKRQKVRKFGLFFTAPNAHLKVVPKAD